MPIIYLFGPDGSGKTTLAASLKKKFQADALKTKVAWMRGTHTCASVIAKGMSHFAVFKGSDNPYYELSIPNNLRRLWQIVEFWSVLPIIIFKFILPSMTNTWVVAERYILDFITWVSITTKDPSYSEKIEARFLLALSCKAIVKIYVTASLESLSARRKGDRKPFLLNQLTLYDKLATRIHAYTLDTSKRDVNQTFEELLHLISTSVRP